ncbi:hypothetical protein CBOM_07425 [Ceraceosorus bombacis]|uniref:Uncharacterized protein n=1 Tax=Ceraceosorus bombacis TaxID=401625 RepID=A0A0P1BDP5_9BASI|nr:hypothetical protein CBOM_07425 [Ceraceosorus bombacis]
MKGEPSSTCMTVNHNPSGAKSASSVGSHVDGTSRAHLRRTYSECPTNTTVEVLQQCTARH